MKSKYFNISENQDGTYKITTIKGRIIDSAAQGYEINPKQPKIIKIRHDGGAWCSLINNQGCALKDTMWVNDVVINDDGSYRVQEYIHDREWKHYDNGASAKRLWHKYAICLSSVALVGSMLLLNTSSRTHSDQSITEKELPTSKENNIRKVLFAKGRKNVLLNEHIHE
ncbi:MAG: hypothetical protein IJV75_04495 [Alphaproteobacteria bacterium]|nr:hypothetical protein [Alphaproteobacteria bacterium]